MFDTIVSGGLAVLPTGPEPADIGISGEHIAAIGAAGSLAAIGAGRTVDAAGQIVIPGGIGIGQLQWTCGSMPPGITICPAASTVRPAPMPARLPAAPIAAICAPLMPISAGSGPVGRTARPPETMVSNM